MFSVNGFFYFIDRRLMTQIFLPLKVSPHIGPFFEFLVLSVISKSAAFVFLPFVQIGVAVRL
jgi:hypothetical protein